MGNITKYAKEAPARKRRIVGINAVIIIFLSFLVRPGETNAHSSYMMTGDEMTTPAYIDALKVTNMASMGEKTCKVTSSNWYRNSSMILGMKGKTAAEDMTTASILMIALFRSSSKCSKNDISSSMFLSLPQCPQSLS